MNASGGVYLYNYNLTRIEGVCNNRRRNEIIWHQRTSHRNEGVHSTSQVSNTARDRNNRRPGTPARHFPSRHSKQNIICNNMPIKKSN